MRVFQTSIILNLITALFLGGLFWALQTEEAGAQRNRLRCSTPHPRVVLKSDVDRIEYIRDVTAKDLTHQHRAQGGSSLNRGSTVGGLGGGAMGLRSQVLYETKTQGNEACVFLKEIDAVFFAKPQIHIARNFSQGTCEYRAVLGHEKKHIDAFRRFHSQNVPKMRKFLRKLAAEYSSTGPIPKSQAQQIQQQIQTNITAQISAFNDRLNAEHGAIQERIDTPKEYARVSKLCRNWERKLEDKRFN